MLDPKDQATSLAVMTCPGHVPSYYVASVEPPAQRPALAGDAECDVCIIGGGFTGLSTALHLAERNYSVVLLEANRLGWGASGRNGGQLASGLRMGPTALVARLGCDEARRLWQLTEEAKALVRERIAHHGIDCELKPGVLLAAAKAKHFAWIAREAACKEKVFDHRDTRLIPGQELPSLVATERYFGGMLDASAAHLHPLKYALGLAGAAEDAGARLFECSRATAIRAASRPVVSTARGAVRAHHIVVCCNGYLDGLERRLSAKFMPLSSYMLATAPLGVDGARRLIRDDIAVCDTKFVVDYFRLSADHRLLFGGGETYTGREPRDVKAFVRTRMLRVFPQLADVDIDFGWGGRVAITANRLPHFGRLGTNVFFAHGFSGHGVALTSLAGKLIAEAVAGSAERFDVFARLPHADLPGGVLLRKPIHLLAMFYYSLRDRL